MPRSGRTRASCTTLNERPLVKQVFEDYASGRFTKQEVLARATEGGLRTRRGLGLSPQSFGQMLKCTLYIGVINSPQMASRHGATSRRWSVSRRSKDRAADVERRVNAIQQKLDRLDEAFLYAQTIDLTSYERQRDKLRGEVTLAQIDRHAEAVEEIDVEGILAFAERVLPRAADLWVQASLY